MIINVENSKSVTIGLRTFFYSPESRFTKHLRLNSMKMLKCSKLGFVSLGLDVSNFNKTSSVKILSVNSGHVTISYISYALTLVAPMLKLVRG